MNTENPVDGLAKANAAVAAVTPPYPARTPIQKLWDTRSFLATEAARISRRAQDYVDAEAHDRAVVAIYDEIVEIEERIKALPAQTPADCALKLAVAAIDELNDGDFEDCSDRLVGERLVSLAREMLMICP